MIDEQGTYAGALQAIQAGRIAAKAATSRVNQ